MTNTCMHNANATQMEFLAEFPEEFPEEFNERFVRSLRLLHSIAGRVLGGSEGVEEAVHNCFVSASRNPPRFESEVAFRGWLFRILIHEALLVRREKGAACRETATRS